MGQYRATFCLLSRYAAAMAGTSHWIRSLCTSTAKVPSRQSMGQSTKPWEPKAPEHMSGTGFWFPTTRSGRSRSRVTRSERDVEAGRTSHLCKRENDLADAFAKKGADIHKPAFRVASFPGQASGTMGGRDTRSAQVQGLERHQGCSAEITGAAATSETQTQAAQGDCSAGFWAGVRLAFSHRPHTLLARQSSRPSHIQRARLAVGTSFRFWWPSFGQRHHSLRQMWGRLLGAGGRAMPQLQRNPRGAEHHSCAN